MSLVSAHPPPGPSADPSDEVLRVREQVRMLAAHSPVIQSLVQQLRGAPLPPPLPGSAPTEPAQEPLEAQVIGTLPHPIGGDGAR